MRSCSWRGRQAQADTTSVGNPPLEGGGAPGWGSATRPSRGGEFMPHVGGQLQAQFMARIRGRDLQRCLVVPGDVGKATAMALGADHYGAGVVEPVEFPLTGPGFAVRASAIGRSEAARFAEVLR